MKYTSELQNSLGQLPIEGTNVVVDSAFEDTRDAEAFVADLRASVGPSGTIIVPTFTSHWTLVGESEVPVAYHNDLRVNPDLGSVGDNFRHASGVLRSGHPTHSFAAVGQRAHDVLSTNRDNNPLGPIKKLNVISGQALLFGLPLRHCTALHLAEQQALQHLRYRGTANRINLAGYEERVVVERIAACTSGYDRLEEHIGDSVIAEVANSEHPVRLFALRELIRAAAAAIRANPEDILCRQEACASCDLRRGAIARQ